MKMAKKTNETKAEPAAKPVSLAPLSFKEALRDLLKVKPGDEKRSGDD